MYSMECYSWRELCNDLMKLQCKHVFVMHCFIYLQSPALQDAQRVFNSVSEVMHFLSHAYHAMSDIMCEFSGPPPRNLRCRPVLIQHSAVLQAGIPIQVIKFCVQ